TSKFLLFFRKFKHAFKGLYFSLKEEKSLLTHIIVSIIILIISGLINKQMSTTDWAIIIIVIFIVIGVELINTAIENIADMVAFKFNYSAKKIKDISAAAALVFSLMAIIVGFLIYIPKFIIIIKGL
ncbi:MAG: diacylglycerol kinase, partial [Malacoplasma sp.]